MDGGEEGDTSVRGVRRVEGGCSHPFGAGLCGLPGPMLDAARLAADLAAEPEVDALLSAIRGEAAFLAVPAEAGVAEREVASRPSPRALVGAGPQVAPRTRGRGSSMTIVRAFSRLRSRWRIHIARWHGAHNILKSRVRSRFTGLMPLSCRVRLPRQAGQRGGTESKAWIGVPIGTPIGSPGRRSRMLHPPWVRWGVPPVTLEAPSRVGPGPSGCLPREAGGSPWVRCGVAAGTLTGPSGDAAGSPQGAWRVAGASLAGAPGVPGGYVVASCVEEALVPPLEAVSDVVSGFTGRPRPRASSPLELSRVYPAHRWNGRANFGFAFRCSG